jgi:hypothetical protein
MLWQGGAQVQKGGREKEAGLQCFFWSSLLVLMLVHVRGHRSISLLKVSECRGYVFAEWMLTYGLISCNHQAVISPRLNPDIEHNVRASFKQFQQVDKGVESAEMEASVAQASVFCFPTSYNPFQTRLQDKTSSAIQACIYIYTYIYMLYMNIYICCVYIYIHIMIIVHA